LNENKLLAMALIVSMFTTLVMVYGLWLELNKKPLTFIGPRGQEGLKGDTGATGVAGSQGIQGIQGPRGIPGEQSVAGVNGVNGTMWALGSTPPTNKTKGGMYLQSNGDIWVLNGTWIRFMNIIGPRGSTGKTGPQGPQGPTGAGGFK